jgi:RNA polymerase sigma-70 factor (ECF subfamily)
MEDAAIVELYWQRSDTAISETDKKYGRYCHTIAYNICADHEDAEECVNDTWFKAWNRCRTSGRPLCRVLGAITRNLAINVFRSRHRKKRGGGETALALDELSECIVGSMDVAREYEQKEFESAIGDFVASLNETEQKVFVSRYYFLSSIEEIADRLHCTQGKVKSILFRVRGKLRIYLQEEGLC